MNVELIRENADGSDTSQERVDETEKRKHD